MLATCAELGTTFVGFSPLGRGVLTGTIRSQGDLARIEEIAPPGSVSGEGLSPGMLRLVER